MRGVRVKARSRLIQEEHARVADHGDADVGPLCLQSQPLPSVDRRASSQLSLSKHRSWPSPLSAHHATTARDTWKYMPQQACIHACVLVRESTAATATGAIGTGKLAHSTHKPSPTHVRCLQLDRARHLAAGDAAAERIADDGVGAGHQPQALQQRRHALPLGRQRLRQRAPAPCVAALHKNTVFMLTPSELHLADLHTQMNIACGSAKVQCNTYS